ncbi:MAG: M48 family metalloprotease [Thermodesulfovibrio sp.]|nr:M48 family metalloprotease [Thermodesulfovibrio sp.]
MIKNFIFILIILFLLCSCKTIDINKAIDMTFTTIQATERAARPISDEEEYFVGRAVAARLLQYYPLYENYKLTNYINLIGKTIVLHSEKPFTFGGYHFAVLNTNEINAFACPGGIILLTRGMIQLAQSEDELAAILAHEIAHINHRDGINSIKQARWTEALAIIGTKAAKQYGSDEFVRLLNIFEGSIDDILKTLVVNGYGRGQEISADEKALLYLVKAGYDPKSLINFLERMKQYGSTYNVGIFKTHPQSEDRIKNIKEKIPSTNLDPNILKNRITRFNHFVKN